MGTEAGEEVRPALARRRWLLRQSRLHRRAPLIIPHLGNRFPLSLPHLSTLVTDDGRRRRSSAARRPSPTIADQMMRSYSFTVVRRSSRSQTYWRGATRCAQPRAPRRRGRGDMVAHRRSAPRKALSSIAWSTLLVLDLRRAGHQRTEEKEMQEPRNWAHPQRRPWRSTLGVPVRSDPLGR
jgi:hypothetical protein